jgi:hypothetical protein
MTFFREALDALASLGLAGPQVPEPAPHHGLPFNPPAAVGPSRLA